MDKSNQRCSSWEKCQLSNKHLPHPIMLRVKSLLLLPLAGLPSSAAIPPSFVAWPSAPPPDDPARPLLLLLIPLDPCHHFSPTHHASPTKLHPKGITVGSPLCTYIIFHLLLVPCLMYKNSSSPRTAPVGCTHTP